jgi:hypothetical protein
LWPEIRTSYIPLDASAALWNQLIRKLGVPDGLAKEGLRFVEIYSINDNRQELRQKYENVYALIFAIPMSTRAKRMQHDASDGNRIDMAKRQKTAVHVSNKSPSHIQKSVGGSHNGSRVDSDPGEHPPTRERSVRTYGIAFFIDTLRNSTT